MSFYYGTKLTKVLCLVVKRGGLYVNPPLRYLSRAYSVRPTEEGLFVANPWYMAGKSRDQLMQKYYPAITQDDQTKADWITNNDITRIDLVG